MNSEECDNESKEQRDGVHSIGGVEALEENKGGYDDSGREADVVHRVDTGHLRQGGNLDHSECTYTFVEKIANALLK
jgi:hypothetical protein